MVLTTGHISPILRGSTRARRASADSRGRTVTTTRAGASLTTNATAITITIARTIACTSTLTSVSASTLARTCVSPRAVTMLASQIYDRTFRFLCYSCSSSRSY